MTIFYKAVRPNGRDFRTNTVDYASLCGTDESLPMLRGGNCCTSGVYHASTSKADTLIGGGWPCRLFEVEGEAVSEEGNKRGFRTLKVIRELPAWEALGPNGEQVVRLVGQTRSLTGEQVDALYAAWYAAQGAARDAAWGAARDAAQGAARYAAWYAAWYAARYAAWYAAWAIVVRDLIPEEQFNILAGPWISVMGDPKDA